MSINEKSRAYGAQKSSIREISAYANARKAEIGVENVFDFSLGNPSIPAPDAVRASIETARRHGLWVSLNLLYFPGITDCEEEIEALVELINTCGVSFIQLRNLNIDPELYMNLMEGVAFGPSVGLVNFRKRLKKYCPGLKFGYFNPYVGDEAEERQDGSAAPNESIVNEG